MNICSEAVIDSIRQGVSNVPPESGGILGGRNDVITNICLDKGILGKHPCSYTPDTRFLNQKIDQWAETGIQFMGMFHVHFGGTESLSEGDKEYIVRIMEVKLIIGDWYQQWSDSLTFSIYDDGTVNVPSSYGLGKWSLVNDNQLILSDFYGETIILKIENIDADNMEVRQVIDGKESQESITFWHTAEGAQTIRVKGYH